MASRSTSALARSTTRQARTTRPVTGGERCAAGQAPRRGRSVASAFDQTHVTRAWTFGRFLDLEFDALALAQQLEHCTANGAAVKEVLDPAFVANEAEAFVDQQARDSTRRHTRVLHETRPGRIPEGVSSCAGWWSRRKAARTRRRTPTCRYRPNDVTGTPATLSLKTGPV